MPDDRNPNDYPGGTMTDDDGGEHPIIPFLTYKRRAWLYRVTSPVSALLMSYGIVDSNTAALWTALAFAVIGNGTAALNTPTKG
jgi:hypothetical protein